MPAPKSRWEGVEGGQGVVFYLIERTVRRDEMKKEKTKSERKKAQYRKPVLTKHKKLRDITAGTTGPLGCTKSFGF